MKVERSARFDVATDTVKRLRALRCGRRIGKTAMCDRGHSIKAADDLVVAPDPG